MDNTSNQTLNVELDTYAKKHENVNIILKNNSELFDKFLKFFILQSGGNCLGDSVFIDFIKIMNDIKTKKIFNFDSYIKEEKKYLKNLQTQDTENTKYVFDILLNICTKIKNLELQKLKTKEEIIKVLDTGLYISLSIDGNFFVKQSQSVANVSHLTTITKYQNGFIIIKNSWGTDINFIGKKIIDIDFFLNTSLNDYIQKAEMQYFKFEEEKSVGGKQYKKQKYKTNARRPRYKSKNKSKKRNKK